MKQIKDLILPEKGVKFILFSGKGGVGKTTMASATAVWLADHGYQTMLLSTDLQKSLNDVFGQETTGKETSIMAVPNLKAMTVETAESLARHQGRMMKALEIMDPESVLVKHYKEELENPAECGCEKAAYFEFISFLNRESEYDAVVFDTAPTGHALDLIRTPLEYVLRLAQQVDHRKKLVEAFGQSGADESIRKIEELLEWEKYGINNLRSPKTSFNMVMYPEAMPFAELQRNIPALENDYKIPVRGIIINNVLPEEERMIDDFWKSRWQMQKKYIDLVFKEFEGKVIAQVPLLEAEAIGEERLRRIGKELYGDMATGTLLG